MQINKIVVFGGGSSYTPELLSGFVARKENFNVKEIVLVDIETGRHKLDVIHKLGQRMFLASGLSTLLTCSYSPEEALVGADFVLNQIRVGGLEGRALDEKISNEFGLIGQETTGAGGLFLALRTIPVVLNIARLMEKMCPKAFLINFTNPAGMVTEAILRATSIRCIGLCNVPINMKHEIAELLEKPVNDLSFDYVGLNHLSFITKVYDEHKDYTEELLNRALEIQEIVANVPQVENPEAVIKAIGLIPSPYLSYFYYENQQVQMELEKLSEGLGTRANEVMQAESELFEIYKDLELVSKPDALKKRGGSLYSEAALQLIEAIVYDSKAQLTVNVLNGNAIVGLPANASVEVNCIVDANGASPIGSQKLPPAVKGLIQQVKSYEQLAIQAVIDQDIQLAKQAILNNPLVHDAHVALKVFDALFEAHHEYLTYFQSRGAL